MKTFLVLYREHPEDLGDLLGFRCQADNGDHAEEQCMNAYPGCDVLWLFEGDNLEAALKDYYFM